MNFAWEAFLQRYRPMATALAKNLTGRPAEADDLVQEAVLGLLRAFRRDQARFETPVHARNYFLRAVRNLAAQSGRKNERLRRLEDEPEARDGDDLALTAVRERQAALAGLLHDLPREDAELIARRFLRGQTLHQVSRTTGVPVSTLHSRERALLSRLRTRLERLEEESSA